MSIMSMTMDMIRINSIVNKSLFMKYMSLLYKNLCRITAFMPIILNNIYWRNTFFKPLYRNKFQFSSNMGQTDDKLVIYSVLKETTFSGGLSDRLRAIVSVFSECKKRSLKFKIYFETLQLQDYLEPNKYDWLIDKKDICYDYNQSYPCTLLTYRSNIKDPMMRFAQKTILKYYLRKKYNQIHIYSNMVTDDKHYGVVFKELFKPTELLQQNIDLHLKAIGGAKSYIAMVFRFRQLLGDFTEGGDTLYGNQRESYVQKCLSSVKRMHDVNLNKRILVTSDSITFLKRVQDFPYVYIIPGEVVHIGFTFDADKMVYMKSFIDYYMLSYAKTVYLVRDKIMYHSGFAYRAALLNGANYKEVYL
jgi:hypothetical protein